MDSYNEMAVEELNKWKKKIRKKPSLIEKASKGVQNKFNGLLPEKYHEIVTSAIKYMTKVVLFGSKYITKTPYTNLSLREREELVAQKTKTYKTTALIEGAGTGAGGIMLDFDSEVFLYYVESYIGNRPRDVLHFKQSFDKVIEYRSILESSYYRNVEVTRDVVDTDSVI